jgi:Derlin-2/3
MSLILSWDLVFKKFQLWRLLTNFIFLGKFSFPFAMFLMYIARYSVQLEQHHFQNRTADFVYMMMFGASVLLLVSFLLPFLNLLLLGPPLIFMLIYLWSRANTSANVSIMGMVSVKALYLPWAMLALDVIFGNSPVPGLLGILVGHTYYFLTAVYPRQSGGTELLRTPKFVHDMVRSWGLQPGDYRPARAAAGPQGNRPAYAAAPPQPEARPGFRAFAGTGRRLAD